jgi:glycine oxidase
VKKGYDVAVVGAGVVGLAVGWRVSQLGLKVSVLDRGEAGKGTSWVAAGMLAPVTEAGFGEDELLALSLESARRYPDFRAELSDATGVDLSPASRGTLYVALDRDQVEAMRRLFEFQTTLGLEVSWVDAQVCRELEPALSPSVRGGILAGGDSEIDPRKLTEALAGAIQKEGGEVRAGAEVRSIATAGGKVTGVVLDGGENISAGTVVIAAGCWSGSIEGIPPETSGALRPVKGQILRLSPRRNEPPLLDHVVRTEEVYLVPRKDGGVVVGATVEEQGFNTSVTAGAVLELLRAADETTPGIREMELTETSAGLRPTTPDNLPLIGPTDQKNLIIATGHWRNGILLAPITAAAIADFLQKGEMAPELSPFSPLRFTSHH